jgi:hypothetical protein
MARGFRDIGNTTGENIGNALAGPLGFGERRPTLDDARARVEGTAPGQITDKRADWGFDVIGALASFAGLATGLPLGTGWVAT